MIDEVDLIVKDDSLTSQIPFVINDILQLAINEHKIPSLKLPMVVPTVVGQSWANFPSGFFGSLLYAATPNGEVTIAKSGLIELMGDEPELDDEGDVEKVAQEGSVLWYRKRPSGATNIIILGYKSPNPLVTPNDTPSYVPDYLHRWILVYGASAHLWGIKEEGVEGSKPNTVNYLNLFTQGLNMLGTWVGSQKKHSARSVWNR